MTDSADTLDRAASPDDAVDAGALLRAGRESAGLSIAAVAQQLKLAPRQVVALEESDFAKLPGRTFIRGFVRNYARLLRLDAEAVLAALPDSAAAPLPDNPSLAPTPRPMGELPADQNVRPSAARWAIPLALVAVVTVAAVYEITRPPAEPAKPVVVDKAPLPVPAPQPAAVTAPGSTTTALPNPLAATDDKAGATPDDATQKTEAESNIVATSPVEPDTPVALSFQGTSWVEVRDGTGVLVLSTTGSAGTSQSVGGRAPFEVILGNAAAVTVSWQGKPFDTTPYTRQNVAKFTLR